MLTAMDQQAYEHYLRVREEVARMKAAPVPGAAAPSRYWSDELANIDYMSEASPLIIRKLRHHAFHVTGLRPYDYREHGDKQTCFEKRLRALAALAGGTDLLVPEAEALGGFGYTIDGRLYNVDTIKFFEVLIGMQRAGVLQPFTRSEQGTSTAPALSERSESKGLVWEIGAGWGGFAYQFKTLFPNTTYVIVDFPELFLFSATYLKTVFPNADVRFWRDGQPTFDRWQEADFIFIPNDRVDTLREARPDLLVNLVSFQEMTAAQVHAYAGLAASIECPALYSLNRDKSYYNAEIDSVGHILSQHYDVREIRMLGSDYTKASKKDSAVSVDEALASGHVGQDRYRHLVGALALVRRSGASREGGAGGATADRHDAPFVGIGVTLHNRATFLCEALDSLLAQSYPHFRLVLVDDGSTDGTEEIARAYERRDPRVRYVRFDERRGMIAAWRSAFELATAEGADYFAWASDHDRWHPRWLETLVGELEANPALVLAYPLTQRTDTSGMPLPKVARQFETAGVTDLATRWKMFSRSDTVAAGDMVYGVMRPDAARRAGIFREVLCPDRLLMAELTLQGQIRQVPEVLWFRRQFSTGSVARQRSSLFAPGAPRPGLLTPPWYMHARSLWKTYGGPSTVGPPKGGHYVQDGPAEAGPVARGLQTPRESSELRRMVVTYAASYAWRHYGKTPAQRDLVSMLGRPRWLYKQAKHGALLVAHYVLVGARRIGLTPLVERVCERLTGRPRPWQRAA